MPADPHADPLADPLADPRAAANARALYCGRHPLIAPTLCGADGLGLDAARVVAAGRPLRIHTGIGHRDGASGWIGVGVARAPLARFEAAVEALGGVQ